MKRLLLFAVLLSGLLLWGHRGSGIDLRILLAGTNAPSGGTPAALAVANAWKGSADGTDVQVTVSPTAGNMLVVGLCAFQGSVVNHQIRDNIGGTTGWTKISSTNGGNSMCISIWYKASVGSGVTTVGCTNGTSSSFPTAFVHEVSGGSQTFTSGEAAARTVTGSDYITYAVENATADSVYFALMTSDSAGNPATYTLTSPWTHKSASSWETDGSSKTTGSMPFLIVSTSLSRSNHWTHEQSTSYPNAIVVLH